MTNEQRKEIIATLLDAGRKDLVNAAYAREVTASGPDQIAATLNGIINQVRGHLRTASGEMTYYINGGGADSLDEKAHRALQVAKRKLTAWESKQLKDLANIADEVKKIG